MQTYIPAPVPFSAIHPAQSKKDFSEIYRSPPALLRIFSRPASFPLPYRLPYPSPLSQPLLFSISSVYLSAAVHLLMVITRNEIFIPQLSIK